MIDNDGLDPGNQVCMAFSGSIFAAHMRGSVLKTFSSADGRLARFILDHVLRIFPLHRHVVLDEGPDVAPVSARRVHADCAAEEVEDMAVSEVQRHSPSLQISVDEFIVHHELLCTFEQRTVLG